jgi:hypothetical protein
MIEEYLTNHLTTDKDITDEVNIVSSVTASVLAY